VFLDSAASSQKPQVVIDALSQYYETTNANIHRGVYDLSERATAAYEESRRKVQRFINARSRREIVFVRNTTEAINLVANAWGRSNIRSGDLIVFTTMEHHSNIVPWQLLAEATGARLGFVGITPDGRLDRESWTDLLAQDPKLVAFTHVSNSLGTLNPVKEMVAEARAAGAVTVIDGAQSVPHLPIDVQDLDCDFFAFSGHKMLAPMGAGVLYGRKELLNEMPPFLGGGSMIRKVTLEQTTWADAPAKFEAGTPSVGDAIVLGTAVDYLSGIGMDTVWQHEQDLAAYALQRLPEVPGLTIHGPQEARERSGVISFGFDEIHPHDVAAILNEDNVAVRAGHHCTQPLMHALDVVATTRASFYLYNDHTDVDRLVESLHRVVKVFA
jgi:cysteine desulfurase/selenocysteine lyase